MSQRERLEPPAVSPLERQLLVKAPAQNSRPNIQPLPPSSVLSKVRSFLPQMQQANEQLAHQLQSTDASAVDIEHIPEGSNAPIIQMDLACGLLELKDDAALAAAQRAIAAGGDVAVETYDGGSSSDDDSAEDNSSSEPSSSDEAAAVADEGDTAMQESIGAAAAPKQKTASAAAAGIGGTGSTANLQHQQQRQRGSRRKVKAKRPMIVEM